MSMKFRALTGAVALAAMLAGAAQAKTFVYCSEGSPEGFSPMLFTAGTTFDANRPIYSRLVQFKPGTTEVEPGLAQSWDVSADGKTYTFHLRHNAKWQSNQYFKPTRGFNADDVLFTFDRQWQKDSPYFKVGSGYEYFNDMGLPGLLDSIVKVDDYTVRITLKKPNAPFLADMAMDFASIESAEYADVLMKAGKPQLIDTAPIGTGPFELVSYQKDATIRYKRFPGYWGPPAKVDNLVFAITKDPAVRLAKLRANECQMAPFPTPGGPALDPGGQEPEADVPARPEHRLSRLQQLQEAVYRQPRARRHQHGDRQGGDPQGCLPGYRPAGEEPDPTDHVGLQQRHPGL